MKYKLLNDIDSYKSIIIKNNLNTPPQRYFASFEDSRMADLVFDVGGHVIKNRFGHQNMILSWFECLRLQHHLRWKGVHKRVIENGYDIYQKEER